MRKIHWTSVIFAVFFLGIFGEGQAKRPLPKPVEPVLYHTMKFVAPPERMGYVEGWEIRTGKQIWEKKIYEVTYNPLLEKDAQDVYIVFMEADLVNRKLLVMDERGAKYYVDLDQVQEFKGFCGRSSFAACEKDLDCIRTGCSGQVCSAGPEDRVTTCEWKECYDPEPERLQCGCVNGKCQWAQADASGKIPPVEKKAQKAGVLAEGASCAASLDCFEIDCSGYDTPAKSGFRPYCVQEKCQCMCNGCE